MSTFIFHIVEGKQRWWCITDGRNTLTGMVGKSLRPLIAEWDKRHGRPVGGYVRVAGLCSRAAAAAQVTAAMIERGEAKN